MELHSLKNNPGAKSTRKRVGQGRASGTGKTCGRGHKGQKARKGARRKVGFEGGQMRLVRRIPKRGFKCPTAKDYFNVNVGDLDRFDAGTEVTVETLEEAGLVKGAGIKRVKVLGRGEITKKLVVKVQAFSAIARSKIEAAGGACETMTRG